MLKAAKKPSMSAFEPIEMRDTVGQVGKTRAICTPWARKAACMSFDDLVFQSIISMLASLGPISLKFRLVRVSTVMARVSINSLRRCAITSLAVRLAVAHATEYLTGTASANAAVLVVGGP